MIRALLTINTGKKEISIAELPETIHYIDHWRILLGKDLIDFEGATSEELLPLLKASIENYEYMFNWEDLEAKRKSLFYLLDLALLILDHPLGILRFTGN